MKLLQVTPFFFPKTGGLENYVYTISQLLLKNYGIQIVIICPQYENKEFSEEFIEGMHIYRLPYSFKISSTRMALRWGDSISRIYDIEQPDIVNGHIPVPGIADISAKIAYKKKIPFILTYHNDVMGNNLFMQFLSNFYYIIIGDKTLQLANRIIVTSIAYALSSPYLNNYMGKIEIIPPGVDLCKYTINKTNVLRPKYDLKESKIILFVGQLNKASQHKGLKYLFEALKMIQSKRDVKLIVVGTGDYINQYKKNTEQIGISENVIFTGYISNEDLPLYYNESDVLVLPSYTRQEGFGMVLIEAQACGTPVIGTNIGGIPSIIQDGKTGLLVPIKNSEKLAEAIEKILSDKEFSEKLKNLGYQNVRDNYTWEKSSQKYYQLISDVLHESKEKI